MPAFYGLLKPRVEVGKSSAFAGQSHLGSGSGLLHSHQPLAVRAKSKSGLISRQFVVFARVQQKTWLDSGLPVSHRDGANGSRQTGGWRNDNDDPDDPKPTWRTLGCTLAVVDAGAAHRPKAVSDGAGRDYPRHPDMVRRAGIFGGRVRHLAGFARE